MKMLRRSSVAAALIGLGSCGSGCADTWPFPEQGQISSTIRRNNEESLMIAVTSSGGGAGDITYRVLNCQTANKMCELLASVDTNDRAAPTLSVAGRDVMLVVNKQDYVANFRNFSREIGSVQPGQLYLQYRADVANSH
jgi:hypothetical protein